MKVAELPGMYGMSVVQAEGLENEVECAYTSDLLSDVMAHAEEGCALITIQSHKNTVAVASLIGASCIVVCNGRPTPDDMVAAAAEEEIPILVTEMSQFVFSGKFYAALQG